MTLAFGLVVLAACTVFNIVFFLVMMARLRNANCDLRERERSFNSHKWFDENRAALARLGIDEFNQERMNFPYVNPAPKGRPIPNPPPKFIRPPDPGPFRNPEPDNDWDNPWRNP